MSSAKTPPSIHATQMADTERQTAGGKVLWHFTMSLDGFVAGPNHAMDWMTGISFRPGLVEEYAETTGAVLGGRDGFDAYPDVSGIYGGAWQGPVFVLTHHPEDVQLADGVTFLSCDVAEAVPIGLEAAGGKNLEVFSATIGRQLLERGLIDEIDLHIAPVLLGGGIRLFDNPGGIPIRLELLNGDDPSVDQANERCRSVLLMACGDSCSSNPDQRQATAASSALSPRRSHAPPRQVLRTS
jgi:dihydrofolate reductase